LPAGAKVAVEATGGYHLELVLACHRAGLAIYVLNPRRVRNYAQGVSRGAKTDRVDAQLIARYLAHEHAELHPWQPEAETVSRLRLLLTRRQQVVGWRVALHQSLADLPPALEHAARKAEKQLNALANLLQKEATKTIALDPTLVTLRRLLRSIPGIGALCSLALCFALKRIAWSNLDAFIASLGLDPRPRDSGNSRGRRKITKEGPALLRKLLYLAGMTAARNPLFRSAYQALLRRGLSTTAANMIIGRKLARIAWAVARENKPFDPDRYAMTPCTTT
jgi:transposase